MTVVAVCCLLLSTIDLHSSFWHLLPAFILGGLGMSFVMTPMSAAAMGAAPVDKAGVALGRAEHASARSASRLASRSSARSSPTGLRPRRATARARREAFVHGLTFAMRVSALICLGGAIAAAVLIRRYRHADSSQPCRGRGMSTPPAGPPPGAEAVVETACRVFAKSSYHGVDHGADRARDRRQRAGALPPLQLEARALPRVSRRRLGAGPRAVGRRARARARTRRTG